jgi:UDP-N-acetylglucosamine/UDP-N-acetylgalactosamine diphosphorylase
MSLHGGRRLEFAPAAEIGHVLIMDPDIRLRFEQAGQGHVFRFFDLLTSTEQKELLQEASSIDLDEIAYLVKTLVLEDVPDAAEAAGEIQPASYIPVPTEGGSQAEWSEARRQGEAALREGRVAAFVVAGGQGTRLGFDAPKGTFPASPLRKAPLFQIFAEKIRAASRRYGVGIPWFIMTSRLNHEATVSYFENNQFFGLPKEDVVFLTQGVMPAVDLQGRILLEAKHRIALSPDGHGGSLRALVRSGAVDVLKARGIHMLSYFQVDNPLVRCLDPEFIGFHLLGDSELSSKACLKAYGEEKIGSFVLRQGTMEVIEYSDLPPALAHARDPDGRLTYRAGSIAIHIFSRSLIERLGSARPGERTLPFHRALKKVPALDDAGNAMRPTEPNAVKFEAFVFDAIPLAQNPVVVQTLRQDEFSPIKNRDGSDSPETSRNDQLRQFARWAKGAGLDIPTDPSGLPGFEFEISPLYADSAEAFQDRVREFPPRLEPGTVLV